MTEQEAIELGKEAIYHATNKDSASGGMVRVYHIDEGKWRKIIEGKDVNELHFEYANRKGLDGLGHETGFEFFNA